MSMRQTFHIHVYLDCMHSLESHQCECGGFNGYIQFMIIENLREHFFFSYENLYFCTNVYIQYIAFWHATTMCFLQTTINVVFVFLFLFFVVVFFWGGGGGSDAAQT